MTSIQATLSEREKTHGYFPSVADTSDRICKALERPDYTTTQALALSNIAMKLARIKCGNPNEADHWLDVAGYATLIADDLQKEVGAMKRQSPEHDLQVQVIRIARKKGILCWAVPNGGSRGMLEAIRLKAEGVLPGVPDITVILPGGRYAGLELKAAKGKPSHEQLIMRNKITETGALWGIAYSLEEALDLLTQWGAVA